MEINLAVGLLETTARPNALDCYQPSLQAPPVRGHGVRQRNVVSVSASSSAASGDGGLVGGPPGPRPTEQSVEVGMESRRPGQEGPAGPAGRETHRLWRRRSADPSRPPATATPREC